jgi:uncharacterized lipoprotein YajG
MRSAECKERIYGSFILLALISVVLLAGCAEKGPILLTIGYQAPAIKTTTASNSTVGVSPLKDGRGRTASVLGKKSIQNGMQNDLVVKGTVSEIVTRALKEALIARGFMAHDVADWDLTAEGMKPNGSALRLGGEINAFWLDSVSIPFKTSMKVVVQLKIVAGDSVEKKIIRTLDVSSKLDQDVLYSRELLESSLSEALTSAIDQIFKDEELKKRLP